MIVYDNNNPEGKSLGQANAHYNFNPLNISRVLPIELDKRKKKYRGKTLY